MGKVLGNKYNNILMQISRSNIVIPMFLQIWIDEEYMQQAFIE